MTPLRVLVACECSGVVREAFRALGCDAWSCDLKLAEDGSPYHIQGDALNAIRRGCPTDGRPWNLVIAHPPCTRLSNSGVLRLYIDGKKVNGRDSGKFDEMRRGARFFYSFFVAARLAGSALCVENPVQHGHAMEAHGQGRPTQIIQPWQFGDDASKATGLWLRGLHCLRSLSSERWANPRYVCRACGNTYAPGVGDAWRDMKGSVRCNRCGELMLSRWANQTDSGQNRLAPSKHRAADRARTYTGIAQAMAEQWTAYLASTHAKT